MPEEPKEKDLGAVWRDQPEEKHAVNLEQFTNRRTRELYSRTRSEIMMSIGAALLFVAVMAWRFASDEDRLQQLGFLAVIVWVLISLYWFRDLIWHKASARDALAATSLEYYRKELERRRDHLRNAWLWHGPLFLAGIIFVATVIGKAVPGRFREVVPVFLLLAVWTGFGVRRRLRHAKEIQREINDIGLM
jgi:hypothetical protein